jgi:transposase-like protein
MCPDDYSLSKIPRWEVTCPQQLIQLLCQDQAIMEAGTMPRKRTTPESITNKLREAEILISQGNTVGEAAKQIGVTEQTCNCWHKAYGSMAPNKARRLKETERENARLKRLVADLSLDMSILCKRWD